MKKLIFLFLALLIVACGSDDVGGDGSTDDGGNANDNSYQWSPATDLGDPLKPYYGDPSNLLAANVNKILSYNGNLYIGGDFEAIGGQIIRSLAMWNGTTFTQVGNFNTPVVDLIVFNNKLYIQVAINNGNNSWSGQELYSWDGGSLQQVFYQSTQTPGWGECIGVPMILAKNYEYPQVDSKTEEWTVHNNYLFMYAKPECSIWGNDYILMKFDGSNFSWHSDFAFNHGILASYNNGLYATKVFDNNTNEIKEGVYKWTGSYDNDNTASTGWENISGEVLSDPEINDMIVYNNQLLIGGDFETIDGLTIENFALYNGSSWSSVPEWLGVNNWPTEPIDFKIDSNGDLISVFYSGPYVGGSDLAQFQYIGKLSNGNWTSLHYNLNQFLGLRSCKTLEFYGDELYLGAVGTGYSVNFLKLSEN